MEGFSFGFLISPVLRLGDWIVRKISGPKPEDIVSKRLRLKGEFENHLRSKDNFGTRGDAIIRDIRRFDQYPNADTSTWSRGASPWFKVELKDIYHRGAEVFASTGDYYIQSASDKRCRLVGDKNVH
jgi:hypothetical protein